MLIHDASIKRLMKESILFNTGLLASAEKIVDVIEEKIGSDCEISFDEEKGFSVVFIDEELPLSINPGEWVIVGINGVQGYHDEIIDQILNFPAYFKKPDLYDPDLDKPLEVKINITKRELIALHRDDPEIEDQLLHRILTAYKEQEDN